jgi:hypothetical protein
LQRRLPGTYSFPPNLAFDIDATETYGVANTSSSVGLAGSSAGEAKPAGPSTSRGTKAPKKQKQMSCVSCRDRKLKCDRGMPKCGTCTRLRGDCEYPERRRKRSNIVLFSGSSIGRSDLKSIRDSPYSHITAAASPVDPKISDPRRTTLPREYINDEVKSMHWQMAVIDRILIESAEEITSAEKRRDKLLNLKEHMMAREAEH